MAHDIGLVLKKILLKFPVKMPTVAEGGKLAPGRVNTSSADRPEESVLVCQTSKKQKGNIAVMRCEWDER
jgi:hypothetical protein